MNSQAPASAPYKRRGVEIHSHRMWDWNSVQRTIDFMSENDLNLLTFHRVDMLDQLTCPEKWLPEAVIQRRGLVRLHTIQNNREYLRRVTRECHRRGIAFHIEIKEISFPDQLLTVVPELWKDDHVCPSHPFWQEFLSEKVGELLRYVPDIDGIIVSPATRESKLSVSTTPCQCERCRETQPHEWYERVIRAIYEPLAEAGKELVVRDFSYMAKDQKHLVQALDTLPKEIVICIKNTPHDFYPTFPDNPLIGQLRDREQWIEYDVWGQYFAWGVFPCIVLDDLRQRLGQAAEQGASGFLARIDLEIFTGSWVMNTINRLNLHGIAMLGQDRKTPDETIYRRWLKAPIETPFESAYEHPAERRATDRPAEAVDIAALHEAFTPTLEVISKGIYYLGHVFHDDSMFPYTFHKAWWTMETKHSLPEWAPERAADLDPTPENASDALRDVEDALQLVRRCRRVIEKGIAGLTFAEQSQLNLTFELYETFVEGFRRCVRAWVYVRRATEGMDQGARQKCPQALGDLAEYAAELESLEARTWYPHYIYLLLDAKRIRALEADMRTRLASDPPHSTRP